jgi:hypothetical protein
MVLLQAMTASWQKDWIVIYVPRGEYFNMELSKGITLNHYNIFSYRTHQLYLSIRLQLYHPDFPSTCTFLRTSDLYPCCKQEDIIYPLFGKGVYLSHR